MKREEYRAWLIEAVRKSGKTYKELESLTGIPKSAIQRYVTGVTRKIPVDRMDALEQCLGARYAERPERRPTCAPRRARSASGPACR